jgi:hypothetical protein
MITAPDACPDSHTDLFSQICSGKSVTSFALPRHAPHCLRSVYRCAISPARCRDRMPVEERAKHERMRHARAKCDDCDAAEEFCGSLALNEHKV